MHFPDLSAAEETVFGVGDKARHRGNILGLWVALIVIANGALMGVTILAVSPDAFEKTLGFRTILIFVPVGIFYGTMMAVLGGWGRKYEKVHIRNDGFVWTNILGWQRIYPWSGIKKWTVKETSAGAKFSITLSGRRFRLVLWGYEDLPRLVDTIRNSVEVAPKVKIGPDWTSKNGVLIAWVVSAALSVVFAGAGIFLKIKWEHP